MLRVLLALCCLLSFVRDGVAAEKSTAEVSQAMAAAATSFLDSLDETQRKRATLPFDDPARRDWHNIPKPERKGLQVREMTAEQRERCHELLRAGLSDDGYDKAVRIMSLENNLLEGEKGLANSPLRDPLRYFLTVFGTPGGKGSWGWSFEGHHLSLNFAVIDGKITGDSPSFWGANPATVHAFVKGGPEVGVRTLAPEEQLAFDLLGSLDAAQRAKALIAQKAPADYRGPGSPQPPSGSPEGIAAAELNEAQKKVLRQLLVTYAGHLESVVAAERIAEIDAAGLDKVCFAWAGATSPGVGHDYRIQGPNFTLELVNVQSDPQGNAANHIHSVWRSLTHDFGVAVK